MPLFKPSVEKLKAKQDIGGLIKLLSYQKDETVRAKAAAALGNMGAAIAVEPLIRSLRDENYEVIKSATKALGDIGDERAVRPLIEFLLYEKELYVPARDTLCKIGKPSVLQLISVLKDWGASERKRAIEILGKIGDKRAFEYIVKALDDTHRSVRAEAEKALKKTGWDKIKIQNRFPATLSGPVPDIEFVLLPEWKEGAGAGERDFDKALSHWNDGDLESAAKAYKKALRLGLTQVYEAAARTNLGKIYFKKGDIIAAVDEFKKVIYISPQRASTAYDSSTYLALIYQVLEMSDDMQMTIELAKKAMKHIDYSISEKAANEIQTTVRNFLSLDK